MERSSRIRTLNLHELPTWMQRDEHIRHGYRSAQNSILRCLDSLWYLHNETVNIWSYLLGDLFMSGLLVWSFFPDLYRGYQFSATDLGLMRFYLVSILGCLLFSVRDWRSRELQILAILILHKRLPTIASAVAIQNLFLDDV